MCRVAPAACLKEHMPLRATLWKLRAAHGESAGKPGSVVGSHSSGIRVTANLKRPTRKRARIGAALSTAFAAVALLPYLALLQVGFTVPSSVATDAVRSYRTVSPLPAHAFKGMRLGGLLSVALSVGSRPPGVTWHRIRRSPDFPPHSVRNAATARPTLERKIRP
jgi:hypothetical protein